MPKGNKNKQFTRAQFVPSSLNEESRTVDVVFATPTPVLRYSWGMDEYYNEVLDMNGANLERASKGLPVLDNHSRWGSVGDTIIGRAENIRREGESFTATVRFSQRDNVQGLIQDVKDGIITDISFGYSVDKAERMDKKDGEQYRTYMVRGWTPNEISFVTIPADPKAGVRSADGESGFDVAKIVEDEIVSRNKPQITNPEYIMKREQIIAMLAKRGITVDVSITDEALNAELERALNPEGADPKAVQTAIEAERKRSADITTAVRAAKLPVEFAERMISEGRTIDEARALVIEEFAKNDPNQGRRSHVPHIEAGADEKDKRRSALTDAVMLRSNPSAAKDMNPEQVNAAREFRGMSLLRMAEDVLVHDGLEVRGMSAREIAQTALGLNRGLHTTSDFPIILGETFNRTLRSAYELNGRTFEPFSRRTTLADFRSIDRVQLSGLVGNFDEVVEGGEYKNGTMTEGKESYKLAKYGKKIAISWESIINDDLSAFTRVPAAFAAKASQKQSDIVYSILLDNPTMADGKALFQAADHKNYVSSGTALNEANMDIAYQKFRVQKSIEGDFLNLSPKYLVVGPQNQMAAYKLTSVNYTPTEQDKVNVPYITGLTVIVEPRITDKAWFLAAEPNMIDTIEYAFLDGEQELFTEQRVGFDVDGIEIKARMVFAAKAIDYRGLFKNAGA